MRTTSLVSYVMLVLFSSPGYCFESSLFSYAKLSGASVDRVQVTTRNGVRGLAPRSPLAPGQSLLSVPPSLLLRPSRDRAVGSGRVPAPLYDRSNLKQQLALTLFAEVTCPVDSAAVQPPTSGSFERWPAAYLACLPTAASFAGLACKWSDDELTWLSSPDFAARAKKCRTARAQFCAALEVGDERSTKLVDVGNTPVKHVLPRGCPSEALIEWCADVADSRALGGKFGSGGWTRRLVSLQLASVAVAMVSSAAVAIHSGIIMSDQPIASTVDIPPTMLVGAAALLVLPLVIAAALLRVGSREEVAFVPVLDLVNHSSAFKAARLSYDLFQDQVSFVLDYPLNAGEEAFFCYGGLSGISNDRLLLEYGFVEVDNPGDTHRIRVGTGNKSTQAADVIVLGRYGKVLQASVQPSEVTAAVDAELDSLWGTSDIAEFLTEVQQERWRLATTWRREKIRILEEYRTKNT